MYITTILTFYQNSLCPRQRSFLLLERDVPYPHMSFDLLDHLDKLESIQVRQKVPERGSTCRTRLNRRVRARSEEPGVKVWMCVDVKILVFLG